MCPTNLFMLARSFPIARDPRLQRGFCEIIHSLIQTKSCILSEWARASISFAAFIKKVSRFFRNKNCSWKIENDILSWILPRFETKKYIPILIDPSFVPNKLMGSPTKTKSDQKDAVKGFFIFSAALPVRGRAISFFQGFYRYTQIDWGCHKSINTLCGLYLVTIASLLKSVLSKTVFIMDRGFGYEHFLNKVKDLKTHYVIRVRDTNTHVTLARSGKKYSINELAKRVSPDHPMIFTVKYKTKIETNLVICKTIFHNKPYTWVLMTDLDNTKEVIDLYKQRMKIEEAFKDWKSTGFDIEKLQIHQWDILPKLIWCVVIAHMLLYLVGEVLSFSKHHKNHFTKFIQRKKDLSFVQLAWKTWIYDHTTIPDLLNSVFSSHSAKRRHSYE